MEFLINEEVILESYYLPEYLEYLDKSFRYIRRKTDLPYELYYDYNKNNIERRTYSKYYILLHQIIFL